ncbi:MAG: hypothetical protein HY914_10970 [Desulfomonile tiedjei]|nr:hypothetical protein [Desulfomonile tiedjei]
MKKWMQKWIRVAIGGALWGVFLLIIAPELSYLRYVAAAVIGAVAVGVLGMEFSKHVQFPSKNERRHEDVVSP